MAMTYNNKVLDAEYTMCNISTEMSSQIETEENNKEQNKDECYLANMLYRSMEIVPGAPEREGILQLLKEAKCFYFNNDVVRKLRNVIDCHADCIEKNLDFIGYAGHPIWIEYDNSSNPSEQTDKISARIPSRMGMLISGNDYYDGNAEVVLAFYVWQFSDGAVHFSPAIAYWDIEDLRRHAEIARFKLSNVRNEVLARVLEKTTLSLTPGLEQEIEVFHGDESDYNEAKEKALEDSVSEIPFTLASLLFLATEGIVSNKTEARINNNNTHAYSLELPSYNKDNRGILTKITSKIPKPFYRRRTKRGEILNIHF